MDSRGYRSSSLPKESQPKRSERPKRPVATHRTAPSPTPGRPSRNLAPPGFTSEELDGTAEGNSSPDEAAESLPGVQPTTVAVWTWSALSIPKEWAGGTAGDSLSMVRI